MSDLHLFHAALKLLRKFIPDPRQLALQLDFFSSKVSADFASIHPHNALSAPSAPHVQPDAALALPSLDMPAGPMQTVQTPLPSETPNALLGPLAQGRRRIQVGEHVIDYAFSRSKRRSIGFVVDDDGLRVTAPKWVTLAEVDHAVLEKQRWILTKLSERRERSARRLQPQMRWCDGGTLPYLGHDITLLILTTHHAPVSYAAELRELRICLPRDAGEQQLKDRVQSWLQNEARLLFAQRLPIYAEKLGVHFHSFRLSSARTQWGSCTADGKIRLNWRLIHFGLPQIDYVIAHELAHLREMNHSPRFWATVQSIFPEFEAARRALRDRAPDMLPEF